MTNRSDDAVHVLDEPVLLTAQEVAAWLRITRRTLDRIVATGGLPRVKVGGSIRFEREAVQAFIDAGRSAQ